MKKFIPLFIVAVTLLACGKKEQKGAFSVSADIKNLPEQKVFLEQLYFDGKAPEVLDTADVKTGKFILKAVSPEEGLFKIRFEKSETVFLLINDKPELALTGDNNDLTVKTVNIQSAANASLKGFINETDKQIQELQSLGSLLKNFEKTPAADSQYNAMQKQYEEKDNHFVQYVTAYTDTCKSPVTALFAIGYIANLPMEKLEKAVTGLSKRFPANAAVASVVKQFNDAKTAKQQPPAGPVAIPQPGDMAPEITMPDTEGKMFSLSSLRGKYVLVDFWASWCGPCRAENPNVVKAFNKYSSKNFTVLGVSLDKSKDAWLAAIQKDGLNWKHISDLKQWESEAQKLYQFDGIPYNVLVDPQGKIIAVSLRGDDLENKLAEVLK